ncbi:hypothetical protein ACMA5I_07995 [Paracoccaceae bacterium GXU_MW_L88]
MLTILAHGGAVTIAIIAGLAHGFALVFEQRRAVRWIWGAALAVLVLAALMPQDWTFAAQCRASLFTFAKLAAIAAPFLLYAYGIRRIRKRVKARDEDHTSADG